MAGIEALDPRNRDDVAAVVALHEALLPASPVVRLGSAFAERFFYGTLLDDGLLRCDVCRRDGRVVGFVAYTRHATDLVSIGARRHFLTLAGILLGGILRAPASLIDLLAVLRLMRQRGGQEPPPAAGSGEGLTVAIDPVHRDFVPPGGTERISVRLFDHMTEYFRGAGVPSFFMLVEPGNIASRRYCEARGCRAEPISLRGVERVRYVYDFASERR